MINNVTYGIAAIDLHVIVLIILMFITSYIFPYIKKSNLPVKHLQLSSFYIMLMIMFDSVFLFLIRFRLPSTLLLAKVSRSITLLTVVLMLYTVADLLYKLIIKKDSSMILKVLTFIPVMAEFIALFCNIFTPIYFEITPSFEYIKLPLEIIHHLLSYFYAVYTIAFGVKYRQKIGKNALIIFFGVVPLPYIISISNLILNIQLPVYPFVALGLAFSLLLFKNLNSLLDPTTQLKNYSYLNIDLNNDKESNYTLVLLDIDKLDCINNLYSYKEGDLLLAFIANIFSKNKPNDSEIYFAGQDEFIISFKNKSKEEIKLFFNDLELLIAHDSFTRSKKYKISFTTVIEEYNKEKYKTLLDINKYLYYKMFQAKFKKQVSN